MQATVRNAVTGRTEYAMKEVDLQGAHAKDNRNNDLPPRCYPQLPQHRHRERGHDNV